MWQTVLIGPHQRRPNLTCAETSYARKHRRASRKNRRFKPRSARASAQRRKPMTKLKLLGAAALVASAALASPVMAQQVITNPGRCAQFYPDANCQNLGPGNPYTGNYRARTAYQTPRDKYAYDTRNGWNDNGWNNTWNDNQWDRRYNSGFWPGDVAVGVV